MTINDQIKDEKLQYDINREVAKISALSSGKLHKYGYLTGEDILPSNLKQIIEQTITKEIYDDNIRRKDGWNNKNEQGNWL